METRGIREGVLASTTLEDLVKRQEVKENQLQSKNYEI